MTSTDQGHDPPSAGHSGSKAQSLIESLPDELLLLVASYLPTPTLKQAALVSKCFNRHATDFLWQHVCLMDDWKLHLTETSKFLFGDRGQGEPDEHDDYSIIQTLYILATNPVLASKVQVLTHRCHLPTPNIFSELPHMYFDATTLSRDRRMHTLLRLAIRNLVNVHTLRIVYGHYNMTRILLGGFLDPYRPRHIPLRKLWIEYSSLLGIETSYPDLLSPEYLTGLESIRIRRLRAESTDTPERSKMGFLEWRLTRGGQQKPMHNGAGGWVFTTIEISTEGAPPSWRLSTPEQMEAQAAAFDDLEWDALAAIQPFVDANEVHQPVLHPSPPNPMMMLIEKSVSTLTSLNLDWILWRQHESTTDLPALNDLQALARLRFPHLRAFQMRNAVVQETRLPSDVYLLEDMFLDFMEAHTKIQCLAWPLDRFYSHVPPTTTIQSRTRKLIAHLGHMLIHIRLDSFCSGNGEFVTDESREPSEQQVCIRRRRFISEFAPYMYNVQQLKLEGNIPRDEKREIVRALHSSPLKKLVLIGVTFPVGNVWGAQGVDLQAFDPGQSSDPLYHLEEENLDGLLASLALPSQNLSLSPDFRFEPHYGWQPEAPFLQTIALHHASMIEELKLCGYNGSPILSMDTSVKYPLLYPLRYFHNLRQLIISFWLITYIDGAYRDEAIIQSWIDARSPSSTAVTIVTPPISPSEPPLVDPAVMPAFPNLPTRPQEYDRLAVTLKTQYAPSALAYRVARDIGPHLSPIAKERPGGVKVRASFCLGTKDSHRSANDIFDLDMRIGKNDQVLEFIGPREEAESGRFWQKLDERQWF